MLTVAYPDADQGRRLHNRCAAPFGRPGRHYLPRGQRGQRRPSPPGGPTYGWPRMDVGIRRRCRDCRRCTWVLSAHGGYFGLPTSQAAAHQVSGSALLVLSARVGGSVLVVRAIFSLALFGGFIMRRLLIRLWTALGMVTATATVTVTVIAPATAIATAGTSYQHNEVLVRR